MSLSIAYNFRHLKNRKLSNVLTIVGIALVISVYTASLMLAEGLKQTLSTTGAIDNVIVIRNGAQNEIQSGISHDNANIITSQPEIEKGKDGLDLVTTDLVVLLSLKKKSDHQPSNVSIRGTSKAGFLIRPKLSLIAGKLPEPGTQEVLVGRAINERFENADLGSTIRLAGTNWTVVGIFDAGNTGFSSELWGDVDVMLPIFKRDRFSSVTFKLKNNASFDEIKKRLEGDPRLSVDVKREQLFYEEQSSSMATFITYFGTFLTTIFSLAAIIGAMITMYSTVSHRTREIGILRALGFSRASILSAFMKEALLLSIAGAALGICLAAFLSFFTIATTNFRTFSILSFGFHLSPRIVAQAIIFACVMGLFGALLPALKASRLKVVEALRRV